MLNKLNSLREREEGFTLIELLIVVIIIGILAAIALPIFIDQQKVAIDASVASDVRNSVTNITNAQAQNVTNNNSDATATLPQSRSNTVFKLNGAAVVDADNAKAGVQVAVPALGSDYTVSATNDGGKKYKTTGYTFTSSTGAFA